MVAYKNFYETIQEAKMRLKNTVVKYDDDFYFVLTVSDHMQDGKFRIYMDQLGHNAVGRNRMSGFPSSGDEGYNFGQKIDEYLERNPDCGVVRKFADSKHFHKFRPFPLGNINRGGVVIYTERTPTRSTYQGLLQDAVLATTVESVPVRYDPHVKNTRRGLLGSYVPQPIGNASVSVLEPSFYDMLIGRYPSYQEVVEHLRDPDILNKGCAFHREYSILRGPLDTLLLCHRHYGIGIIDENNNVTIGSSHEFLKEEIAELGVFNSLTIKEVKNNA